MASIQGTVPNSACVSNEDDLTAALFVATEIMVGVLGARGDLQHRWSVLHVTIVAARRIEVARRRATSSPRVNGFTLLFKEQSMLNRLYSRVVDFLRDEEGPTAVEYAVMLALIIVVCLAAISVLGSNASGKFVDVALTIGGG